MGHAGGGGQGGPWTEAPTPPLRPGFSESDAASSRLRGAKPLSWRPPGLLHHPRAPLCLGALPPIPGHTVWGSPCRHHCPCPGGVARAPGVASRARKPVLEPPCCGSAASLSLLLGRVWLCGPCLGLSVEFRAGGGRGWAVLRPRCSLASLGGLCPSGRSRAPCLPGLAALVQLGRGQVP